MAQEVESSILYKLDDGYRLTKIIGAECTLILRDAEDNVAAILDACNQKITRVCPYREREITAHEKHILHKFIRAYRYRLNEESALELDLSILRFGEEVEEYLSEHQLAKRLKEHLTNARLFVGKLKMRTLHIPGFSKGGIYNFSHAEIKKLVIGKNCDLLIDVRNNQTIESLRVQESFTGSINMSRNTVESIEIGNNCRCDLAVYDSLRCFNLMIADVYSGNLNIKNSCFHALSIGYYCYANIKLTMNWGRRDISIGDSFRGNMLVDSVSNDLIKVGKDCKGKISISSKDEIQGNHKVEIAEDFGGILDLRGSQSVESLNIGRHARGKINLLGCPSVKVVKFDRYFSGYVDFSESGVEYVRAKYGSSGEMVFLNCDNLALLKLPRDRNSAITIEKDPIKVERDDENLYYKFSDRTLPLHYFTPLYKKVYNGIRSMITGEPE